MRLSKTDKTLENAVSSHSIPMIEGYAKFAPTLESPAEINKNIKESSKDSERSMPNLTQRNSHTPAELPNQTQTPSLLHPVESLNIKSVDSLVLQSLDPEAALYAYDVSKIRYNPQKDEFYQA